MFLLCVVDGAQTDYNLDGRSFAADGLGRDGVHAATADAATAAGSAVRHGWGWFMRGLILDFAVGAWVN